MHFTKLSLAMAGLVLLPVTGQQAYAQTNITDCAVIEAAQERLACYDRAAGTNSDLPVVLIPRSTQPQPQLPSESSPANGTVVRQEEAVAEQKPVSQSEIQSGEERSYSVLSAKHNDFTGWTIEFEEGGTWKQVGTDDYDIKVGERYSVRRTAINAYMLSNSRNNRKMRITPVER